MKGILAVGFVIALVIWGLRTLPGWWTGPHSAVPVRSRHEREFLAMILMFASMLGILGVSVMIDHGVIGELAGRIILVPLAGVAAFSIVSTPAIYWFNRPKFLVPPRLRRQPGRWRQLRGRK